MNFRDLDFSKYDTLFLDRDGVINRLRPNDYVKSWKEFEFLPDIVENLVKWSGMFKYIFIVTNQRGVGKGIMTESNLIEIHRLMLAEIEKVGGRIDRIYYCTDVEETACCRKPNIGMAMEAKKDFPDIDFERSLMIGDSPSDLAFAANCGMKGVLVK